MTTDLEKQLKIETIKCAYCGKERIKSHSDLGKTKHSFCSKGCFYKWRKENKKSELFNKIEVFETHAEIIINSNKYGESRVLIDLEDVEKCKNKIFSIAKCGNIFYAIFRINSKIKRLHQYLLNCNGQTIDHINHNGLDNRKENLRIVSKGVNSFNRSVKLSNTGHIGITYNKTHNLYQIRIVKQGKEYRKPSTKDLETAIKYKQELEMELYGEIRQ